MTQLKNVLTAGSNYSYSGSATLTADFSIKAVYLTIATGYNYGPQGQSYVWVVGSGYSPGVEQKHYNNYDTTGGTFVSNTSNPITLHGLTMTVSEKTCSISTSGITLYVNLGSIGLIG